MAIDNKKLVAGLRELADFFEQHPAATPGYIIGLSDFSSWHDLEGEEVAKWLAARTRELGNVSKRSTSDYLAVGRKFGPVLLEYLVPRDAVCTSRVVGKKTIKKAVNTTYEEVEVDEIEWDCNPILGS
jgi:hypothetical protein